MEKQLLEAAERGDAEAQFNLGIIYENNLDSRYGGEGSRPEAMRWLRAAAKQGLPRAQVKLAEIYAGDATAPENAVWACGWYLLATAGMSGANLQNVQIAYQRTADRLNPVQIAEAESFARQWTATIADQNSALSGGTQKRRAP